jgi:hypothetical protein
MKSISRDAMFLNPEQVRGKMFTDIVSLFLEYP